MDGWFHDKAKFYEEIDILCLPSREKPFGIVILEGFLYSKTMVVSNTSGPLEILSNGEDALVFKNEDFNELANLLEKLIKNNELALRLTENGFKKLKLYDINFVSNRIANIIKDIV